MIVLLPFLKEHNIFGFSEVILTVAFLVLVRSAL